MMYFWSQLVSSNDLVLHVRFYSFRIYIITLLSERLGG